MSSDKKKNSPERENMTEAISIPSSCSHVHNLGSQGKCSNKKEVCPYCGKKEETQFEFNLNPNNFPDTEEDLK